MHTAIDSTTSQTSFRAHTHSAAVAAAFQRGDEEALARLDAQLRRHRMKSGGALLRIGARYYAADGRFTRVRSRAYVFAATTDALMHAGVLRLVGAVRGKVTTELAA